MSNAMTLDYEPMMHAFIQWYVENECSRSPGSTTEELILDAREEWRKLMGQYQKIKAELPPVEGWVVKTDDGWIRPGHG